MHQMYRVSYDDGSMVHKWECQLGPGGVKYCQDPPIARVCLTKPDTSFKTWRIWRIVFGITCPGVCVCVNVLFSLDQTQNITSLFVCSLELCKISAEDQQLLSEKRKAEFSVSSDLRVTWGGWRGQLLNNRKQGCRLIELLNTSGTHTHTQTHTLLSIPLLCVFVVLLFFYHSFDSLKF